VASPPTSLYTAEAAEGPTNLVGIRKTPGSSIGLRVSTA